MTCASRIRAALVAAAVAIGFANGVQAGITVDSTDDFLSTYTGPHRADLDVTGVEAYFDGTNFTITGYMAGVIDTSFASRYVWGVNRGGGTAGFAVIGATNVLFDRVIAVNTIGATTLGGVNLSVTIHGNAVTTVIPASLLPNNGFNFLQYTWNLWPRSPGAGNGVISDFAPDNSNIATTAVPEPTTLASAGLASLIGLVALRRRGK